MRMHPLFTDDQWPRVEMCIREGMEEFTRQRLQPPGGSSAQYPDSAGSHTSSVAQRITDQRSTLPTPMPQDAQYDPTRVRGVFVPSQNPTGFSFRDGMRQQNGRGNETIDSACYTTFDSMNMSSHAGTCFAGDKSVATDDRIDPGSTLWLPGQGLESLDNISGLPSNSGAVAVDYLEEFWDSDALLRID
jgi:hypothetical protein